MIEMVEGELIIMVKEQNTIEKYISTVISDKKIFQLLLQRS